MKVTFQLGKQINISLMPENEDETITIKELIRHMGSVPRQARVVPPVYLDPVVHFVLSEVEPKMSQPKNSPEKNTNPA